MSKINIETVLTPETINLITWVSQREAGKEWQDGQKALEVKIADAVESMSMRDARETLHTLSLEQERLDRLRDTVKATKKTIKDALLSTKEELPGFD